MTKTRKFKIFHATGMNPMAKMSTSFEYTEACEIQCYKLHEVFSLAQNFNKTYSKLEIRSTSVGDIIMDVKANKFFMIKGLGLIEITEPFLLKYLSSL